VSILDQLATLWDQILKVTGSFVIPDWGALVALLPVLLVVFVIGPVLTLTVLAWLVYVVRKPRPKVVVEEGPRRVELAADGSPQYPVGLPYCPRDGLVLASGTTRCPDCGDDLAVICPMCGLGRAASVTTCGNCGLVLRVENRTRVMRPVGPPPGGAAVA
jgi:hypothetical protein